MTGEDYLIYMGKLNGMKYKDAKKKAQELCQYFGIFKDRNRLIDEYSGGMKQKIGIAAALIHDPKVIILDEPTANLDPIGRANIIEKIKEISKTVGVFVSSHILSEIEQMCKKVTLINEGEIVISDTIRNIKKQYTGNVYMLNTDKNPQILDTLLQKDYIIKARIDDEDGKIHIIPQDPIKLQEDIASLVIDNNAVLYGFHQPELSLQDIFMEIMAKKETEGEINE
jgi:ABC-2 type transport system ATP-binding protein